MAGGRGGGGDVKAGRVQLIIWQLACRDFLSLESFEFKSKINL